MVPTKKYRIIVLDDEAEMRRLLCDYMSEAGFDCTPIEHGKDALQLIQDEEFDLLITDLRLKDMNGIEVLEIAKKIRSELATIAITAFGSIEEAIQAMKLGAYHYITKPFKMAEVMIVVRKAIADRELRLENVQLKKELTATYSFANIIGRSPAMQQIFQMIQSLSMNSSNVLITGESGTGKELVAKAIHYNSPLKGGPFMAINCSAIPEGLLETELFGHIKGAFTGATSSRRGLLEAASEGTLFLDEIGDLPLALQAKLLRVLQDQMVRPVGGDNARRVNIRIISATHRKLEDTIQKEEFRSDLFYRLNVIPLHMPKLADRLMDIPLLVHHFMAKHAEKSKTPVKDISKPAINLLLQHSWPGNVRELENVIERSLAFSRTDSLEEKDIMLTVQPHKANALIPESMDQALTLAELETEYIKKVLNETQGQKDRAAKILGINRRTLYRKALRYGIDLNFNRH